MGNENTIILRWLLANVVAGEITPAHGRRLLATIDGRNDDADARRARAAIMDYKNPNACRAGRPQAPTDPASIIAGQYDAERMTAAIRIGVEDYKYSRRGQWWGKPRDWGTLARALQAVGIICDNVAALALMRYFNAYVEAGAVVETNRKNFSLGLNGKGARLNLVKDTEELLDIIKGKYESSGDDVN